MMLIAQSREVELLQPDPITLQEADIGCRLATLFHPVRRNAIARNFDVRRLLNPSAVQVEAMVYRVALAFGKERADIYLGRGLIERSLETLGISAASLADLDRWELTSCLNIAWRLMLESLATEIGAEISILDAVLADGETIPTARQGYWFGVGLADRTFETCLIIEPSILTRTFLASLTNERLPPPTGIATVLPLQIGSAAVPASVVRGLGLGDVVLLPPEAVFAPRLILDTTTYIPCQIQNEIWPNTSQNGAIDLAQIWQGQNLISRGVPIRDSQQNQKYEHGKTSMSDNDPINFDPSNVEVDLRFIAGSIKLPISELGQIGPGYVFNLDSPVAAPITLQVNGRRLAIGELVSIQGELGVRILRTFDSV